MSRPFFVAKDVIGGGMPQSFCRGAKAICKFGQISSAPDRGGHCSTTLF